MSEEVVVYRGSPSLMVKAGSIVVSVLLIALFVAGGIMFEPLIAIGAGLVLLYLLGVIIAVKQESYEVTTQRVRWRRGIVTKRTEELELYRVQDVSLIEPLSLRLVGAGNVRLSSADNSTPSLELKAVKNPSELREHLRANIEECRTRKGVRVTEFDAPGPQPG